MRPRQPCVICKHGVRKPGKATFTIARDAMTLVVRHVPAEVCDKCAEEYFDSSVAAPLADIADEAERAGVQVDVRDYVAA